jgi:hypothetical protein
VSTGSSYTTLTQEFLEGVRSANDGADISIILIGSVARSTQTSQSDLDLLVIGEAPPILKRRPDRLHVQALTVARFRERLRAGDDFAAWCVRYGVPILISDSWLQVVKSPEAETWPDWHKKLRHAARRLTLASTLVETDDLTAAAEEMLYSSSHTARAILLKAGVFPLSRPEIIGQLGDLGEHGLAKLLQELSYGEPTSRLLKRALLYIKRLLVRLDRASYSEWTTARRQQLLAKRKPHGVSPNSKRRHPTALARGRMNSGRTIRS